MLKVTGLILRRKGIVVETNGTKSIIQLIEEGDRKRISYYLVTLHGQKYIHPMRLSTKTLVRWKKRINIKTW